MHYIFCYGLVVLLSNIFVIHYIALKEFDSLEYNTSNQNNNQSAV